MSSAAVLVFSFSAIANCRAVRPSRVVGHCLEVFFTCVGLWLYFPCRKILCEGSGKIIHPIYLAEECLPQLTEEWSAVSIKELALIIGTARWGPQKQLGSKEDETSSEKGT